MFIKTVLYYSKTLLFFSQFYLLGLIGLLSLMGCLAVDEGEDRQTVTVSGSSSAALLAWLCQYIPRYCPGPDQNTEPWVMAVGGAMENEQHTGIFSLMRSSPVPSCLKHLADFPAYITAGQGASIGSSSSKMPLVCGGGRDNRKCYSYSPSKNSWTAVGTMPQSRMHAGHANLEGTGLVMAGGFSADGARLPENSYLNDVLSTADGRRFHRRIPNLPRRIAGNCLVAVNKEKAVCTIAVANRKF